MPGHAIVSAHVSRKGFQGACIDRTDSKATKSARNYRPIAKSRFLRTASKNCSVVIHA